MLAIVAPGQGSQKPGMLAPWLEVPGLAERAATLSDAAGIDLVRLGTTAGADEIKDTAVTQPLVVVAALLAARQLDIPAAAVAGGHSVGELAAAAIAGVISDGEAAALAGVRGRAMAAACALTPSSMAVVLGGNGEVVTARLAELELTGANVNGAGQVVAAGELAKIETLLAEGVDGARVMPLAVAGAFHTHYMASAQAAFASYVAALSGTTPTRALLTNADGCLVADGPAYLQLLITQITRPVRWDLCMETLAAQGVTGVLELPPAGALVGLVKRQLKGTATLALKGPEDLDKAIAFMAEHSQVQPEHSQVQPEHSQVQQIHAGHGNSAGESL
ncbi:ACP S-malonyltransferase [Nakamurella antarctica]|uniref:[acyl-carrier-protein] S-malonyltransferase n=1 Tax=Nakamurella antarctica TaxID=1902245 RepID=A0A3G8ZVZ5_9ACTN|nr:ACP S-malonyltransferase [Nakamurella antarctica]AZI58186.1 ACP S-malonyltransferase [Nakamurella antarctica]